MGQLATRDCESPGPVQLGLEERMPAPPASDSNATSGAAHAFWSLQRPSLPGCACSLSWIGHVPPRSPPGHEQWSSAAGLCGMRSVNGAESPAV